jgi:hypothetical protein
MTDKYQYFPILGYDSLTSTWHEIRVNSTGNIAVQSPVETKIYDGDYYNTGYYNNAVADAGTIEVLLQPNGENIFINVVVINGGDCEFRVYEGVTHTDPGTSLTALNSNRDSSNTTGATWTHTPTVSGYGTTIWEEFVPGGTKKSAVGSTTEAIGQGILKASTDYVFRLTNVSGAETQLQLIFGFYEE